MLHMSVAACACAYEHVKVVLVDTQQVTIVHAQHHCGRAARVTVHQAQLAEIIAVAERAHNTLYSSPVSVTPMPLTLPCMHTFTLPFSIMYQHLASSPSLNNIVPACG